MGWTFYNTFTPIDRKSECRRLWDSDRCEILKDALVGTTWYAAIKNKKTNEVFAAVFLTQVHGSEFGYKDMDETFGPCDTDCPNSILKLLTPTSDKYALQWRKECEEKHRSDAAKKKLLKDTPYGGLLRATLHNGIEYLVVKRAANLQFKTDWLQVNNENKYIKKTSIKDLRPV